MMTAEAVKFYSSRLVLGDDGTPLADNDAGDELVRQARAYQHEHPGMGFSDALDQVSKTPDGEALVRQYGHRLPSGDEDDGLYDPSEAAHKYAVALQRENPELSYMQAVEKVMQRYPDLSRAYAAYNSGGEN